jgi:O-glycosyl hydrolase
MPDKFNPSTILNAITRFSNQWDCPAGVAHKRWAKEILELKHPKVNKSDEFELLRIQIGAVSFSEDNRKTLRAIARKVPGKAYEVYKKLSPAKKAIADEIIDNGYSMDLTNWFVSRSTS